MNAKNELLELAGGEEILSISLGEKGWAFNDAPLRFYPKAKVPQALELLGFEFNDDFGVQEGYSLYAWTRNWIILKGTYDGSEWYERIPRNPNKEIKPQTIGGG